MILLAGVRASEGNRLGFIGAVKSFFSRYIDFTGRSPRSAYWWVILFQWLIVLPFIIALFVIEGDPEAVMAALEADVNLSPTGTIVFRGMLLFILAFIIPTLSLMVRRLHDQDKPGWWVLIWLVPYLGTLVIFIFMLIPGTKGLNRFGDDPLDLGSDIGLFD